MKKLWVFAVLGIMCACASTGNATTANLDAAIQQTSRDISASLPQGTKLALLNFSSPSDVLSDYVLEEMSIALVKERKLVVVDRKEIDLIRGEMNFQMSGEVSDESAQEIGKLLGAQSIVTGSLVNMGETHRFRTKVINVISAAIETSSSISIGNDSQMQHLLAQNGGKPAAQTSANQSAPAPSAPAKAQPVIPAQLVTPTEPAQSTAPAAPEAPRSYKVGDTGPAGGLIFYDKGNNSGGWRYLEAAPVEAEFQAVWNVRDNLIGNTQPTIGGGRRNTQLIVEKLRQIPGEWDTAAQMVGDLEFNGFDDWFIPSRDELDQMYGNLKRKNLGDFKNEVYWTSTEYREYSAHGQDFRDGRMSPDWHKKERRYVRPIRQVRGN